MVKLDEKHIKILNALAQHEWLTHTELWEKSGLNKKPFQKKLYELLALGFLERNPAIQNRKNERGRKIYFRISSEGKRVLETEQLLFEIKNPFLGSFILKLPTHFGKKFTRELCTLQNIEDLNKIMLLGLEFWINKHAQVSFVRVSGLGKDFNNDGIPDLMICETPQGYPNIRKALREHKLPMPLLNYALGAAEEKLTRLG